MVKRQDALYSWRYLFNVSNDPRVQNDYKHLHQFAEKNDQTAKIQSERLVILSFYVSISKTW